MKKQTHVPLGTWVFQAWRFRSSMTSFEGAFSFGAFALDALLELAVFTTLLLRRLVVEHVLLDVLGQTLFFATLFEAAEGFFKGFAITGFDADHAGDRPSSVGRTIAASARWQVSFRGGQLLGAFTERAGFILKPHPPHRHFFTKCRTARDDD